MGIYIKNKEKPKNCYTCTFRIIDPTDGSICGCVVGHIQGIPLDQDRSDDCPIEEIDLVRCSECMYWHKHEWYNTCDKHIGHGFPSDYFCGDGERRTDERTTE